MSLSFPKTREQLAAGELYVHCPKCQGNRYVYAATQIGNGWRPTVMSEFPCELCHMTGEADRDRAIEFLEDWQERINWENAA